MSAAALVHDRNIALSIAPLAMKCDRREMPLLAAGAAGNGQQYVAAACTVAGTIVDAITSIEQHVDVVGLAAFAVEAGRMMCIVAPLDNGPAAWFAARLSELRVEVTQQGGLRRKARTVAIEFDEVRIVVTDISRVLRSMMQTGQADALVVALSDHTKPSSTSTSPPTRDQVPVLDRSALPYGAPATHDELTAMPPPTLGAPVATEPMVENSDASAGVASQDAPFALPGLEPASAHDPVSALPRESKELPVPVDLPDGGLPPRPARRPAWIVGSVAALAAAVVAVLLVRASTSSDKADPSRPPPPAVAASGTVASPATSAVTVTATVVVVVVRERPAEWPSPTPAVSADTARFVAGVGRPIPTIVGVIGVLVDGPKDAAACRAAAVELDAAATPEEFGELVAATPDPVLGGLLAGLLRVTGDAIAGCTSGADGSGQSFEPVRETLTYIEMRERELGVD